MFKPEEVDLEVLKQKTAEELVTFAFEKFGQRAAIGTSFQLSGIVLIHMAAEAGLPFRVFTADTLRLHPETYDLMAKLESRYDFKIEQFKPDPQKLTKMLKQHGEHLFFDSKEKQEYCCFIRKVEPNEEALKTVDAWITGLRRDQSENREETPKAELVDRNDRQILKLAPVADWSEEQLRSYIKENWIPYNPLFDQGYSSIGCIICSTPIRPGEDSRAGRWRWFNAQDTKKECGIHLGD